MTIGIIGSGAIGTALARTLSRAGVDATISNSRGPESLKDLVCELGPSIKAGTREEAARADIVFVAVNWTKLRVAMANLPDWKGRIVIDANNPIEAPLFKPRRSRRPRVERGVCRSRARSPRCAASTRNSSAECC